MAESLHLFFTNALPQFEAHQTSELLLVEDDGAESTEGEPIPDEELAFVTTLVTNYQDFDALRRAVDSWWLEWAGAPVRLELIADQASLMAADSLSRLRALEGPSQWSINTAFVAYRHKSATARAEAVRFLVESSTRSQ